MKKPYQLRLDEEMINQVKENAILNDRSVNAEFRNLIRKSLNDTTQVDLKDEIALIKVEEVAIKNGLKKSKPDLINLAIQIASETIKFLDDESFENVTTLKK